MHEPHEIGTSRLEERVAALASSVEEIAGRLSATELATGDEKTAKELRRAVEAVAKHDPKLETRLTDRIDVLLERLGTLASAVSTTSAELARRDGEIASLRRDLERGSARVEALGDHVGRAARLTDVEKLRQEIGERPTEPPTRSGSERLERVEGKLTLLGQRIDTLSPTVAAAASGLAARDGALANLRQQLGRSSDQVEQLAAEVRADPRIATLATRLDSLANELEAAKREPSGVDGEIAALRARIDDGYAKASAAVAELHLSLSAVGSRLGAIEKLPVQLEHALAAQAGALDERLAVLADTVTTNDGRLAQLAAASSEQTAAFADTRAQIAAIEQGQEELRGELERASIAGREQDAPGLGARIDEAAARATSVDAELQASLEALLPRIGALETLPAKLEERARPQDDELERRIALLDGAAAERTDILDDLGSRLATVERRRSAPIEEIDKILDTWASDRSSLEAQLNQLAAALAGTESVAGSADGSNNAAIRLRDLVGELQLRISTAEREITALRSAPGLAPKVEEIVDRLEVVERNAQGMFAHPNGPVGGDGRFRLELRALELRLEQATASADENRDALLAQLERIASRLERRLQRLEAADADFPHDEPEPAGAQIVPFRGAEL